MENIKTLLELRPGESAVVVDIQGGFGIRRHLESLGVRIGKRIIKIGAQLWRGPQVIRVDNIEIAIGFGMSRRVLVRKVQ